MACTENDGWIIRHRAKYIDKLGKIILVFMPHIIHVAGNGRFIAWAHSGPDGARTALDEQATCVNIRGHIR